MMFKPSLICLVFLWITMSNPAAAQRYVTSPEVQTDGKVTFRYFAPNADKVDLSAGEHSVAMIKDEEGVWEKTIGPLTPDTYAYRFNVDGATVLDPVNRKMKAWLWMENMVDVVVEGSPPAGHQVQDVPHGELHMHLYQSKQLNKPRHFSVYLPPGYAESKEEYPVLYLLHGFGDDESAWPKVGMANNILDNVWAADGASPFIVVMPFGHASLPTSPNYNAYDLEGNAEKIETELMDNIKPMVESRYRCSTDPKSRGIAGLSMGGGQAIRFGFSHTDQFGWITGYSASIEKLGCYPALKDNLVAIKKNQPRLSLVCGDEDFLYEENVEFQKKLTEQDIKLSYHWSKGGHSWDNWRAYLAETARTMFVE